MITGVRLIRNFRCVDPYRERFHFRILVHVSDDVGTSP